MRFFVADVSVAFLDIGSLLYNLDDILLSHTLFRELCMKRLLYTTLFVSLVLVLAVAAVFALRGPATTQTAAAAPAAESASAPALAPTGTDKYNLIALPLDSSDSFNYTASGLMGYVNGATAVMKWDAANQHYVAYTGGPGDFALEVGGAYFLLLDSTADNVLSFVGDVPAEGSVSFSLVKETGSSGCKYNLISIPLDQDGISTASDLMSEIGGVDSVSKWDATNQHYVAYTGGPGDFAVSIGYPYLICLNNSAPSNWP